MGAIVVSGQVVFEGSKFGILEQDWRRVMGSSSEKDGGFCCEYSDEVARKLLRMFPKSAGAVLRKKGEVLSLCLAPKNSGLCS